LRSTEIVVKKVRKDTSRTLKREAFRKYTKILKNAYKIMVWKPEGKRPIAMRRRR